MLPVDSNTVSDCSYRSRGISLPPSHSFDRAARTLRIEYDATRLNAAAVTKLVREAGLDIAPDDNQGEPLIAASVPAAAFPPTT